MTGWLADCSCDNTALVYVLSKRLFFWTSRSCWSFQKSYLGAHMFCCIGGLPSVFWITAVTAHQYIAFIFSSYLSTGRHFRPSSVSSSRALTSPRRQRLSTTNRMSATTDRRRRSLKHELNTRYELRHGRRNAKLVDTNPLAQCHKFYKNDIWRLG